MGSAGPLKVKGVPIGALIKKLDNGKARMTTTGTSAMIAALFKVSASRFS